jgi:RNA recognition motif-containing protein
MKIILRNLPRDLTEAALRELLSAFGRVQSCDLVMDPATGMSKGFGFAQLPLAGEAKAAIKGLNGKEISGVKIRVKKAEEADK